jgi:hypothetical protein
MRKLIWYEHKLCAPSAYSTDTGVGTQLIMSCRAVFSFPILLLLTSSSLFSSCFFHLDRPKSLAHQLLLYIYTRWLLFFFFSLDGYVCNGRATTGTWRPGLVDVRE